MFKKKYMLIMGGMFVFLLFIIGILILTFDYVKLSQDRAFRELEEQIKHGSEQLQFHLELLSSDLLRIERYLVNTNMELNEELYNYLDFVKGHYQDAIPEILILDAGGNMVVSTNPSSARASFEETEYFKNTQGLPSRIYLSEVISVSGLNARSYDTSMVIKDSLNLGFVLYTGVYSKGVFKGAVLFVIKAEPFFNQYSIALSKLTSGYGFILRQDGRILFHRDVELRGRFVSDLPESSDMAKFGDLLKKSEGKIPVHQIIGQQMMITSKIRLENQRWTMGVLTAGSKFAQKTLNLIYVLSGLIMLLGTIIFGLVFSLIRLGQVKETLIESEIRLNNIFKSAKDVSLVMADLNGKDARIMEFSPGAERMFKYSREEVIGKHVAMLHRPEDSYRISEAIEAMKQGKEGFTGESTLVRKSGELFPALFTTHPILDAQGKMIATLGVSVDITIRKRAEKELAEYRKNLEKLVKERTAELEKSQQALVKIVEDLKNTTKNLEDANMRLQEVDRLKSVFLASMSHELRTPLNSIIGFTGIMLMGLPGDLNDEQKKQLTMVKNSADHLLSLINDVLDISRIEAGKIELSLEEFKLQDTVREVLETVSSSAVEKGLELVTDVPEDIMLLSDRRRVKQILINIVGNAVKFIEAGSIRIKAKIKRNQSLEITVADTGIGIKEEDLSRLFQPFQQIDMTRTKKFGGTGLGLHISQKLATIIGGHISAKSEYGKGSEFTLSLPRRV